MTLTSKKSFLSEVAARTAAETAYAARKFAQTKLEAAAAGCCLVSTASTRESRLESSGPLSQPNRQFARENTPDGPVSSFSRTSQRQNDFR